MYQITDETIKNAYKPFDIVTDKQGNVGFVKEVSLNRSQPTGHQVQYHVEWLVGEGYKVAWFDQSELTKHCNFFIRIAESVCHPFGRNGDQVKRIFSLGL